MIKKAVVLAAGFGTRVLPASKAVPKEMLTIVDKPAIQYVVEELALSGIEQILIVLSRSKTAVQDHFDRNFELEQNLLKKNRPDLYDSIMKPCGLAKISYVLQQEAKGTGAALQCAKDFLNGEMFIAAYADDVFVGKPDEPPVSAQLADAAQKYGKCGVAMKEVPTELVKKYSSLKVEKLKDNVYSVTDMIEKPREEEMFSNFSVLGRCLLDSTIFDALKHTEAGAGNEIQLTDAMKEIARTKGMFGVDFVGTRYDAGSKIGLLKAQIEVGLQHPETEKELRNYLRGLDL